MNVLAPADRSIVSQINTDLRPSLERLAPELASVLPAHISPEKMIRMVITAVQDTPALLTCERTSLFRSVMTAAVLGLEVDAKIGLAYILPFKGRAQFIPGYKGYITLAQNAGFYVSGNVVRAGDDFEYEYGTNQFIRHKVKDPFGNNRGEVVGAYAIAKNPNGVEIFKVMGLEDIFKARAASAGYKSHLRNKTSTPWVDNPEAMYIKTAIRALAPQLPTMVQRAAAIETHHEDTGRSAYLEKDKASGSIDVVFEKETVQNTGAYDTSQQPNLIEEMGV